MLRTTTLAVGIGIACVASASAHSSADIKQIQRELLGHGVTKLDGKLGPETRNAIRAYQRDWQLPVTGKLSTDLLAMLRRTHPRTRPQWIKVVNMKCLIWNQRPQPRETAFWTGKCVDGRTSG